MLGASPVCARPFAARPIRRYHIVLGHGSFVFGGQVSQVRASRLLTMVPGAFTLSSRRLTIAVDRETVSSSSVLLVRTFAKLTLLGPLAGRATSVFDSGVYDALVFDVRRQDTTARRRPAERLTGSTRRLELDEQATG